MKNLTQKAKNPLISIIVPVYNGVAEYIDNCIQSIRGQLLEDFECILIDDASTDNSMDVARENISNDSRFRIIRHDTNQGQGMGRNTGISNAKGEYLCFIDSDDYVQNDYLKVLYEHSVKHNADIVTCPIYFMDLKNRTYRIGLDTLRAKNWIEAVHELLDCKDGGSPCNRLFKKELFLSVRFPSGYYEDKPWYFELLLYNKVEKISHVKKPLYIYVHRLNSSTTYVDKKKLKDAVTNIFSLMKQHLQHYGLYEECKKKLDTYFLFMLIWVCDRFKYISSESNRRQAYLAFMELLGSSSIREELLRLYPYLIYKPNSTLAEHVAYNHFYTTLKKNRFTRNKIFFFSNISYVVRTIIKELMFPLKHQGKLFVGGSWLISKDAIINSLIFLMDTTKRFYTRLFPKKKILLYDEVKKNIDKNKFCLFNISVGRVGSTALEESLNKYPNLLFHTLRKPYVTLHSNPKVSEDNVFHVIEEFRHVILNNDYINNTYIRPLINTENSQHRVLFLVPLREPLERLVSGFFSVLHILFTGQTYNRMMALDVKKANKEDIDWLVCELDKAFRDYVINKQHFYYNWFETDVKTYTDFAPDEICEGFDRNKGYAFYKRRHIEMLVYNYKLEDTQKEKLINQLMQREDFKIISNTKNESKEKKYKHLYQLFIDKIKVPDDIVEKVTSYPYFKVFFSDVEQQQSIQRWSRDDSVHKHKRV